LEVPGPRSVCTGQEEAGLCRLHGSCLDAGPRAIPVPGTRPALLKLKGPRKNPGPNMRGRL